MINIVKQAEHEPERTNDVYIGPGSSLANKFKAPWDGTEKECQEQHETWFRARYAANELSVPEKALLNRMLEMRKAGKLNLMCTCINDYEHCHGQLLKRLTEARHDKYLEKTLSNINLKSTATK